MIEFLSGAVTLSFLIAAGYFLRFWRRTADRLFLAFACAFVMFAAYQFILFTLGVADERNNYAYLIRVLGFAVILWAIVDKNLSAKKRGR
jgi:hypothetical protein